MENKEITSEDLSRIRTGLNFGSYSYIAKAFGIERYAVKKILEGRNVKLSKVNKNKVILMAIDLYKQLEDAKTKALNELSEINSKGK
jgi:DNA invertase Pin-like site-specific DNA recombinase